MTTDEINRAAAKQLISDWNETVLRKCEKKGREDLSHIEKIEVLEQLIYELLTDKNDIMLEKWFANELADFKTVMHNCSIVYDHVTGGQASKPMTDPQAIIGLFNDYVQGQVNEAVKEHIGIN